MMQPCVKCGSTRKTFYATNGGIKRLRCYDCFYIYLVNYNRNKKQRLVDQFGGKCICCGYDKYIGALEFHHLDPATKDSKALYTMSYPKALEEAKKCALVCSNCHREIHAGIRIL